MKIGTYNVFFQDIEFEKRFENIILSMIECDIICLQEIPQRYLEFCEIILSQAGFYNRIYASCGSYGNLTASKYKSISHKIIQFQHSQMGRNFIISTFKKEQLNDKATELLLAGQKPKIKLNLNPKTYYIINTHLESLYKNMNIRKTQMNQIIRYCKQNSIMDNVIILGDMNTVYKKITFDYHFEPKILEPSWFSNRFFEGNKKCNFDRIYCGKNIKTDQLVRLGDQEIHDINMYPSDHDGFYIQII